MINVSAAFKAALEDDNRKFSGSCTITLNSGKVISIDDSQLWDNGFVLDDSTSNTGSFDVGSAIVQKFTLRLNNIYDDFTDYDFTGAEVSDVRVSLDLSGKPEAVEKGTFTVNDTTYDGDIITLECLDNMHKFDVSYSKSKLTYPATLLQIVQDACKCCNVILATNSLQFEYHDYVIPKKPDDDTITFRDVLSWVGQVSGHFWKCNKDGQLSASWYKMSDLSAGKNVHTLRADVVTDISTDMDDVVITCVKVVTEDGNSNQVTFQSGSDGYGVVVDGNKLINGDNGAEIASMIGGRTVGLRFRPMTVSTLQDPTIEAGDAAIVYDRKLKSYKTFFTNVVFSIDSDNQMSNSAESALRNSAERFSEASKIYQDLKRRLNKNKSELEKAMEELEKAMKEQVGLYPVTKTLDDGSKMYYMCDHPILEESSIIFELNAKGWAVSTDGGKTWNAGLSVDGSMITQILNTIGINADWINTGEMSAERIKGGILRLGGDNNINGQIKVLDSNGVELLRITSGGIVLNNADVKALLKILRSGVFFYDSNEKRKLVLGAGGLTLYTDYTDANNYKCVKLGKYGIYAAQKNGNTEELWMDDKDHTWNGYILRFLNNAVRLNANAVYTDGCSMGKNLTTSGTLTTGGDATLKGGCSVGGTLSWYDYEQQTESSESKTKRQPVASAKTDGNRVAYLITDRGSKLNSSGTWARLGIRGQWGSTGRSYQTIYLYTDAQFSDIRLKKNIKDSEVNALNCIEQMRVRQFDWKKGGHQTIGFVADELEEIDPALALGGGYDKDGEMNIKQINATYLLSYAIKAIQELNSKVEEQDKRIKELERRLNEC